MDSLSSIYTMWLQRSNTNSSNGTSTAASENLENSSSSLMSVQQLLEDQAERFRSDTDVRFLIEDPQKFAKLQRDLRRSGAVTNGVLKHGIHFYARDHAQGKPKSTERRKSRKSRCNQTHSG